MQQHMEMNDAGNFLIETCDEVVSRDLKQQLLLLNGRWRELFVKVKHVKRRPLFYDFFFIRQMSQSFRSVCLLKTVFCDIGSMPGQMRWIA